MTLFANLERRRVVLEQTAENSSRTAMLEILFRTNGNGELVQNHPIDFGMAFIEQPAVMTGVALKAGRLHAKQYPNCCAGVFRWVKDKRGFFVGARLFFVVDSGGRDYDLEHSVVFKAQAIKMMPDLLDI